MLDFPRWKRIAISLALLLGVLLAIPSLIAKRIADALIAGRPPGHPYLGVCTTSEISAILRSQDFPGYGDLVSKAIPGTPAEQAGLKAGDVIEKVDGSAHSRQMGMPNVAGFAFRCMRYSSAERPAIHSSSRITG